MNKKLISILLVFVMICSLLPMAVLADGGEGYVAVVVYGKNLTRIIEQIETNDGGITAFKNALEGSTEDFLAGEHIPDISFVLKNEETKEEYKMQMIQASVFDSVSIVPEKDKEGIIGNLQDIVKKLGNKVLKEANLDSLAKYTKDLYVTYKSEAVPVGTYTLQVGSIDKDGYSLSSNTVQLESYTVEVEKDKTTYTGTPKYIGAQNVSDLNKFIKENFKEVLQSITPEQINSMLGKEPEHEAGKLIQEGIATVASSFDAIKGVVDLILKTVTFGTVTTDKLVELIVSRISESGLAFAIEFPGIWLSRMEPGFEFKSVNFAGEAVPGSEFMMVNRDELEKIVKAMISAGKVSFEAAMETLGDETSGASWEDINLLNKEIVTWNTESGEIGFNSDEARRVLTSYITLLWNAAMPGVSLMMSKEADLHFPAILKATADANGIVRFEEDNNYTLVWSIDIITKLIQDAGNIVAETGDLLTDVVADNRESQALIAVVELTNRIIQATVGSAKYSEYLQNGAEVVKKEINQWVYPILQNDDIPAKISSTAKYIVELFHVDNDFLDSLLNGILPTHAILTSKMPTGNYIMLQSAVPVGYVRNPVFYTVNVKWDTTADSVYDWVYVDVANIGIVGPYFGESYYTFLRNNSLIKTGDIVINMLTRGKYTKLLEASLDSNNDITASMISYYAGLIYNSMGGSNSYDSAEALAEDLSQYLYSHGKNTQNLWIFVNKVASRKKDVITGGLDREGDYWYFYNIKENLHSNGFDSIKAILNGVDDSLSEKNLVSSAVKNAISAQVSIIEKVDTAITKATASYTAAVKNATSKVATAVKDSVTTAAKSIVSSLFKKLFK